MLEGGTLLSNAYKQNVAAWLPGKKFQLLYKGTRDGFDANDFHRTCDNKGATITFIQSSAGFIFGGYTGVSWDSSGKYRDDATAFLFTLTNPHGIPPTQYVVNQPNGFLAIEGNNSHAASFGGFSGITVISDAQHCSTNIYFPEEYVDTTGKGDTTFTGGSRFSVLDVEVFAVIS